MAELSETVGEAVAEVAETVAEEAMNVANASYSISWRSFDIGFVVGSAFSGAVVFWATRRILEKKYNQIAEDEIEEMREHYRAKKVVTEDKPRLEEIVEERGYVPPPPGGLNVATVQTPDIVIDEDVEEVEVEIVETVEMQNIFQGEWDYGKEASTRTFDKPYVIHQDEYTENDFTSVTLTYYEGDDILCDEDGKPVDNKDRLVGEDNLSKFGHGSNSPHIVYIRNEVLSLDIEVVKREGSFIEEVHGLKHSDHPRRVRYDYEEEA